MSLYLNHYEIDRAADLFANHPALGPATQTLRNLQECADANSDGWAYWPKPSKASHDLQHLISSASFSTRLCAPERVLVMPAQVRATYRPIRAFLTRAGLSCTIVDPAGPCPIPGDERRRIWVACCEACSTHPDGSATALLETATTWQEASDAAAEHTIRQGHNAYAGRGVVRPRA